MIRTVVFAVVLLGALGCDDDPELTQLVVLVNSDFQPVTELAHVRVEIGAADATAKRVWDMVRRDPGKAQAVLPFSFGIEPPGGDAGARVDLTVTGLGPDMETRVRRRVRVGFVAHQVRLLKIDLTHDCAARFESCEAEGTERAPRTCIGGECASIDVDVRHLPQIRPGDELAGALPLPWHCTRECTDGGAPDARTPTHGWDGGVGSKGGTGEIGMDATVDSAGVGAVVDESAPGPQATKAGPGPRPGETAPEPPIDDCDAGEEDGSAPSTNCGGRRGFFKDVARPLTETAEGTLCATLAQNRLEEQDLTLEQSTTTLTGQLHAALAANLDMIELYVAQSGSTLYASGVYRLATNVPELSEILDYAPLRDSDQPLKLNLTETLPDTNNYEDFARGLLSLLLAKQESAAGGYAIDGRPVYLIGDTWQGALAALAIQRVLADDASYAALRRHLHFGFHLPAWESAEEALADIDSFVEAGFEFVDIQFEQKSLIPLARDARRQGLAVFVRECVDPGMFVPLCGIADVLETPAHAYEPERGSDFRAAIKSSRTLVALDVAGLASNATQIPYSVQPSGTVAQSTLGAGAPSLTTGSADDPLPGTALAFDATSNQRLALNDPRLPATFNKLAVLALLQFDAASLPPQGRAVIVSKREGSTGWALELVDNAGAKELQFETFVRYADTSVHALRARIGADAFDPGVSHHVLAQIEQAAVLRLRNTVDWGDLGADFYYTVEENDAPLTLGGDPGLSGNAFNGKLQLFKLVSYSY